MTDGIVVELDNELSEIERFDALFRAFAARHALADRFVFQVTLAFEELLTNTISYGYPQGGRHKIGIALEIEGDCFRAELIDGGVPFNPLDQPEPDIDAPMEEREIGGLGIHFVRTVMDDLDYCREKDQNRLVMTKRIATDRQQE
ncbi:MAG: ATP-binding protein [Aliidongia sp.]